MVDEALAADGHPPTRRQRRDESPVHRRSTPWVGWIIRDPDNVPDDDGVRLKQILARCPELDATRRHVGAFATIIRERSDRLADWIDNVRTDDLPPCIPSPPACSMTRLRSQPGSP